MLAFPFYGAATGALGTRNAEDDDPRHRAEGVAARTMQLRSLVRDRAATRALADRLGLPRVRLWAVGVVVNTSDLGADVITVESANGVILRMRRIPGSMHAVCAVPEGISRAVVAFT